MLFTTPNQHQIETNRETTFIKKRLLRLITYAKSLNLPF